ncbi:pumilio-family RNA binding repeat domain-containing protein [Xylariaceae sp. FL0255]|nr:pumilio-family RNA binding repeat domain-containing protein [Xylariaceae sp. FL0255]
MPKPRSKRQAIREERKKKRQEEAAETVTDEFTQPTKRQRRNQHENDITADQPPEFDDSYYKDVQNKPEAVEREFFGMLSDQEQEYFRSVDEQLDIDNFPSQEERQLFLASVFAEAQGKELKLACSQSCSRLMERLILMSNARQKKKLFEQFATHFLALIQHRFASHCCETLFLQSAPIVTRELGGKRDDMPAEDDDDQDQKPLPSMEELFLLSLDELEGRLTFLLTDRFASHTLRVLLLILSGRPLDQAQTKSLIHSKKKEKISAPWTFSSSTDANTQLRAVPNSFNLAAKKIIADSVSSMSTTELRVLATHPTGNPVLQLLLELDIELNSNKSADESSEMTVLYGLLPGAPASLKDSTTPASDFVNSMLYDAIGSRVLETLVIHCPGKVFKVLYKQLFSSRMHSFLRNDIACYPAIRVLNRLSKDDLVAVVNQTLPDFGKLMTLSRFNSIKALFERSQARQAYPEVKALAKALVEACENDSKNIVPRLCLPPTPDGKEIIPAKYQSALISAGAHLTTALLTIPGTPQKIIQASISVLSEDQILELATSSAPTSHVLVDALATPSSQNKIFHKALVALLRPYVMKLALSEHGNKVLCAIISVPSRSEGISLPFHIKESIVTELGQHEAQLRDSYEGRRVWRTWKGDLWKTRRTDWIAWAKEIDESAETKVKGPDRWQGGKAGTQDKDNPNNIKVVARDRGGIRHEDAGSTFKRKRVVV